MYCLVNLSHVLFHLSFFAVIWRMGCSQTKRLGDHELALDARCEVW